MTTLTLAGWTGPWPKDDKDANLKADIAAHAHLDPLSTITNLSTTETATNYLWHFGDGTTSSAPNASHQYNSPGSYPILLEMETGGNCTRSLDMEGPQNVEILPVPVAAIDVTPNQVDILDPEVWAEYLGDSNVDCYYNFGDGNGLEGC